MNFPISSPCWGFNPAGSYPHPFPNPHKQNFTRSADPDNLYQWPSSVKNLQFFARILCALYVTTSQLFDICFLVQMYNTYFLYPFKQEVMIVCIIGLTLKNIKFLGRFYLFEGNKYLYIKVGPDIRQDNGYWYIRKYSLLFYKIEIPFNKQT